MTLDGGLAPFAPFLVTRVQWNMFLWINFEDIFFTVCILSRRADSIAILDDFSLSVAHENHHALYI